MGDAKANTWLSREQWEEHPNYPRQTLLLHSHLSFLAINDYLVEQASRPQHDVRRLELRYRYWISAMRSHEHYEERKLYPFLEGRFGISFETSRRGHELLHEKHAAVLQAFQNVEDDDESSRARLVAALQDHLATLHAHLKTEEEAVIPLLLELAPEEFEAYYHS